VIYRLGDDMAVRLPRIPGATGQVDKEHQWLPRLAPLLPLAIPVPLAKGTPGAGYPWQWSVYRWLAGENAIIERLADPYQAATALAHFIAALQRIDPTGGPPAGPGNLFRGVLLAMRDPHTRTAIASLHGTLDPDAVTAAWKAALRVPTWHGPTEFLAQFFCCGLLALGLFRVGRVQVMQVLLELGINALPRLTQLRWRKVPAVAMDRLECRAVDRHERLPTQPPFFAQKGKGPKDLLEGCGIVVAKIRNRFAVGGQFPQEPEQLDVPCVSCSRGWLERRRFM
jgi:hypothetical protein